MKGGITTGKNIEVEKLELEKRYQEIIEKFKKKKKRRHKKRNAEAQAKKKKGMQHQKPKVKILKRKQKKSKERAQELWCMMAWRRQEKQVEDILDFTQ